MLAMKDVSLMLGVRGL